jgi:hypothetical protein
VGDPVTKLLMKYEADCPWCGTRCWWHQIGFEESGPTSYDIQCDCWKESGHILEP